MSIKSPFTKRNQKIFKLRQKGIRLEDLGRRFGISRARVWQILQKGKPAARDIKILD